MKLKSLFKKIPDGHYRVFKQTLYNSDIGKYTTYGIKYSKKIAVNDVSCDIAHAQYIARCLNQSHTEPSELSHAIESLL